MKETIKRLETAEGKAPASESGRYKGVLCIATLCNRAPAVRAEYNWRYY
jgi:hypothetical protein